MFARHRVFLPSLLLIAALAVAARFASGQAVTGTIEAVVVDAQGAVLPGTSVTLQDAERGTILTRTTDSQGRVQFLAVPVGTYELRAVLPSFAGSTFSNVLVNPGSFQTFRFQLGIGGIEETVTVIAESPLINLTTAKESITVDDKYLEELPLITRNYTEMATIFPGVAYNRGARTAYNQFNVRGGATTDNVYLLDGGSLNRGIGRAGILVAPSFIERMEFIPGGFPAEYGGYQSSVINIVSRTGTNDVHGSLSIIVKPNALISEIESGLRSQVRPKPLGSTRFYEGSVGGPIKRDKLWYFAGFQYNSEEQGTILSLDPQPRNITVYPAHLKLTYQQNEKDRWEFTAHSAPFTDNYTQLSTEVAPESDRKQDITTWDLILRQQHVFESSAVLETNIQYFYMSFHNNRINDDTPLPAGASFVRYFDRQLGHFFTRGPSPDRFGVSAEGRIRTSVKYTRDLPEHTFKFGGEWAEAGGRQPRYREVPNFSDLRNRGGPLTRQDPYAAEGSLRDTLVGLFVQDNWTPSDRVAVDAGIRLDWQRRAGWDTMVSPRLGVMIDPLGEGRQKIFANAGIYYSNVFDNVFGFADSRPPMDITYIVRNPDENLQGQDVIRSIQRFRLADDLRNPYIIHFSLGYEQQLPGDLKLGATVTRRQGRNQPTGKAVTVSPIEVIQVQDTDGKLEYTGLELSLQKVFRRRWQALISYTLGDAENQASGVLSPIQQAFSYGPAEYDQRHTVMATGTVVLPGEIHFTGLFRGNSGRPYSITNDDPSIFAAYVNRQGQVTGRNEERQPSNWTIDFTVSRDFAKRGVEFRPLLQVINATNRVNVIAVSTSLATAGRPTNIDLSRQVQFGIELRF